MSNLQPTLYQGQSFTQRARQTWLKMIEPHPSIKALGEFRRAQLLSILTLILSIFSQSCLARFMSYNNSYNSVNTKPHQTYKKVISQL